MTVLPRRGFLAATVAAAACAPFLASARERRYDLIIRNALIVDGAGGPAYRGDVAVRDGRLALVGQAPASVSAVQSLDAGGRVVSPGFIDAHAHGDPLFNRSFANFVSQGVTTVALGQDGETPGYAPPDSDDRSYDLASWATKAITDTIDINIAPLSGHGSLRWEAGVGVEPVPTLGQMETMKALLKRDLDAGAFGLSSGLEYAPGLYAEAAELDELARVVGAADGVIMSHMRSEDDDKIGAALDELLRQGRHARVHFSHMKIVLGHDPAQARAVLDRMKAARVRGVRITGDAYPYLAGFADITLVFPSWAKTKSQFADAMTTRHAELEAWVRMRIETRNGPDAILIASGPLAGKTLVEAADLAGKPFWIYAIEDMGVTGPSCAHFVQDGPLQDVFLTSDIVAIATDGAPWMEHPRSWGSYSRMIEEYVVKRRSLTLEAMIHKMTGLPASIIGLQDRGLLRPGLAADLVMFDPDQVRSKSSWLEPRAQSEGFDLVLINGVPAFQNAAMTGARPGRILTRGQG